MWREREKLSNHLREIDDQKIDLFFICSVSLIRLIITKTTTYEHIKRCRLCRRRRRCILAEWGKNTEWKKEKESARVSTKNSSRIICNWPYLIRIL